MKKEEKVSFMGNPCAFCKDIEWWDKNEWGYVDLDDKIFVCAKCNKLGHKIYKEK